MYEMFLLGWCDLLHPFHRHFVYRWSFTRVIWGVATLLVYIYNVELLQDTKTPLWSFVILFVIFVVCEIVPIVILLDYSYYMQLLMGRGSAGSAASSSGDDNDDNNSTTPLLSSATNTVNNISLIQPNNRRARNDENDPLLSTRPLQTMDHLLLTSPRTTTSNTPDTGGNADGSNQSRRVRFQDDVLLESL